MSDKPLTRLYLTDIEFSLLGEAIFLIVIAAGISSVFCYYQILIPYQARLRRRKQIQNTIRKVRAYKHFAELLKECEAMSNHLPEPNGTGTVGGDIDSDLLSSTSELQHLNWGWITFSRTNYRKSGGLEPSWGCTIYISGTTDPDFEWGTGVYLGEPPQFEEEAEKLADRVWLYVAKRKQ